MLMSTHIGRLQGQREGGSRLTSRKDDSSLCLHKETAEEDLQLLQVGVVYTPLQLWGRGGEGRGGGGCTRIGLIATCMSVCESNGWWIKWRASEVMLHWGTHICRHTVTPPSCPPVLLMATMMLD